MGIGWIQYRSKEEIERQQEEYEKKIFPLGSAQKEVICSRIRDLFQTERLNENELLYCFLVLKEVFLIKDEKRRKREYRKWYYSAVTKRLSEKEKAMMIALVNADIGCEDLDQYKDSDTIGKESESIQVEKPDRFSFL